MTPEQALERMAAARVFVDEHLPALISGALRLQDTAVLEDGPLRDLRAMVEFSGGSGLALAESLVREAALRKLQSLFESPATPRAVLIARLRSAGVRLRGGVSVDAHHAELMIQAADALEARDHLLAATQTPDPDQRLRTRDPMEQIIERALIDAGLSYRTDKGGGNPAHLDFYLPAFDLHIEVKRMHSERIGIQMGRAENVIAVQGEPAVLFLADLIRRHALLKKAEFSCVQA